MPWEFAAIIHLMLCLPVVSLLYCSLDPSNLQFGCQKLKNGWEQDFMLLLVVLFNTWAIQPNLLNIMMPSGILNRMGSYVQYYRSDQIQSMLEVATLFSILQFGLLEYMWGIKDWSLYADLRDLNNFSFDLK